MPIVDDVLCNEDLVRLLWLCGLVDELRFCLYRDVEALIVVLLTRDVLV